MSLGAKLRELRVKKALSLQDLADAVGASKAHIWDLERNRSKNPSIDLLTKLSKALGVSVSDLIGENPGAENESPQLVAMYRDFKKLSEEDREAIQKMVDHLNSRKGEKE